MAFGFSSMPGASLDASMMGSGDPHVLGASPPKERRQVTLSPFGYLINGTAVANETWAPEVGESVTMTDSGGKPIGEYRFNARPPEGEQKQDAAGLPGLVQGWLKSIGGN